ncbi:MAG: MarP family serine protease, partial [Mycobacteriales bacterium]
MHGDLLDLVLLAALAVAAVSGYRQGFIVGLLSLVGFLGAGILGTRIAVPVSHLLSSLPPSAVGLAVVFLMASLGQLLASAVGIALRRRVTWLAARRLDAVAGGVLSIVPVLFIAWLLGRAVVRTSYTTLVRQVDNSEILTTLDRAIPPAVPEWFASFFRLVERNGFPALFSGIGTERLIPVAPPNPAVLSSAGLRAAAPDIVKIVGIAPSCSRRIEGSGFLYAPGHILTNAHVVAGVRAPTVQVPGGGTFQAEVVLYDPQTDIAVLWVPQLNRSPLKFAGPVDTGASAIVAGYPEDGPFNAVPARVRVREEVRGPDIYQNRQVTRQVYALRATVQPGNSGGPLLSPSGGVYGVVFAASTTDPQTGYALTAAQVASDAQSGSSAT